MLRRLALILLVAGSVHSIAEEVQGPTEPIKWTFNVNTDFRPFDGFQFSFGADMLHYVSPSFGVGVTGRFGFVEATSVLTYLDTEVGVRTKHFIHGDNATSGVFLSPSFVWINWESRNAAATSISGFKLGIDAGYEGNISPNFFYDAGLGLGFYLKKPEIQSGGTHVLRDSTLDLKVFANIGVRF